MTSDKGWRGGTRLRGGPGNEGEGGRKKGKGGRP